MTKHVLVVDDNAHVRKAICAIITRDERLSPCTEAENGFEGVQIAKMVRPDLVVMDFSMPEMNGLEAAKRIAAQAPNIKIVLFTLHENFIDKATLGSHGISALVSKQKAGTDLLPAICSLLGFSCAAGAA